MTNITLALIVLLTPITAFGAAKLSCSGKHVWYGEGLADTFKLTALVENSNTLLLLEEKRSEEGFKSEFFYPKIEADLDYRPNGIRYQGFNRFALRGDLGKTNYFLLLPKNLGSEPTAKGFVQRPGNDTYPTVRLRCNLTQLK